MGYGWRRRKRRGTAGVTRVDEAAEDFEKKIEAPGGLVKYRVGAGARRRETPKDLKDIRPGSGESPPTARHLFQLQGALEMKDPYFQ
ncbi:hypothetical protein NDU88_010771 [Pleurodeles waltl]|uniref:Uncharacterized protein n=1 Tax=Pleurodeles waltl TaxID=8319 RepID=A0AAV7QWN3_PLEWA|nr:hypothetical protein NDU88_010771 [Pleurodeles waltl]